MASVDEIPIAHTPPGGYGTAVPAPVLANCAQPLVAGAPDLRGVWKVIEVRDTDGVLAAEHRALGHVQRVEQCGDRLVVTGGGIVHDMRCDGTIEHGVHDVAESDYRSEISVVASYEDGVHVLRPQGLPIEVKRWRDGDEMVWQYLGFTARLVRVPDDELT